MIAISSFKPFCRSEAVAANALAAKASWETVFEKIIYVGQEEEPQLDSPKTEFVSGTDCPPIKQLAELAASQSRWSCLINADIVATPLLLKAEKVLAGLKAVAAMSLRWQDGEVKDNGLDFFCACPKLWKAIAPTVPADLRIGRALWDTWMLAAFGNCGALGVPGEVYDLTMWKMILHPKHEDRDWPKHEVRADDKPLLSKIRWPKMLPIYWATHPIAL